MTNHEAMIILHGVALGYQCVVLPGQTDRDRIKEALDVCDAALENEPVRHGKWVRVDGLYDDNYYTCSVCDIDWCFIEGDPITNGAYYCPNCGAKMDAEW